VLGLRETPKESVSMRLSMLNRKNAVVEPDGGGFNVGCCDDRECVGVNRKKLGVKSIVMRGA